MNIGKIPENVLKRSILKKIDCKRSEILVGANVGEDCACLQLKEDEILVLSTNPYIIKDRDNAADAVTLAMNNVASEGAEPIAVMIDALLPENTEESDIKKMTDDAVAAGNALSIALIGGHTEITDAVSRPVLSLTGIGKVKKESLVVTSGAKAGDDVVITKWIGLEGTVCLVKEQEEKLLTKFPAKMIYDAGNFAKHLSVVPEAATAVKSGVTAMHDLSKGGVFGGLWELAESSGVGLLIDLRKIPVKQETIEICNFFDINPYEMLSGGSLLCTSRDGNKLVLDLKEAGIEASVIGKCTDNNDRVLINGENKRFLEPSRNDEIFKALKKGE